MKTYARALTIAGSDSGGGAGIQADLKTFSALEVFGMSVITAITSQNTREVRSIQPVMAKVVRDQLECVLEDIGTDAIKIGMVFDSGIVLAIEEVLNRFPPLPVVLDPVMVSKSGDRLLQSDTVLSLKRHLLPLASVVTPNLPEAEVLAEMRIESPEEMETAAALILEQGAKSVLIKGGHLHAQKSDDFWMSRNEKIWYRADRITTQNTHGTGCTFSSAIAAYLARGEGMERAIGFAKKYLTSALHKGSDYKLGSGHGPVHHFWDQWEVKSLK